MALCSYILQKGALIPLCRAEMRGLGEGEGVERRMEG